MNRLEHMRFNMLLFEDAFEDVITWQDLFVQTEGPTHRKFRHDPDTTPTEAVKHFIMETNTYPESKKEAIVNVIKSHIACDLISSSCQKRGLHGMNTLEEQSVLSTVHGKQVINDHFCYSVIMYVCKECCHKTLTINMIRTHYQRHHPNVNIPF